MTISTYASNAAQQPRRVQGFDLQDDRFILMTDSQDIEFVVEYLGAQFERVGVDSREVSALLVETQDDDYVEVWASETSQPYSLSAYYTRVI